MKVNVLRRGCLSLGWAQSRLQTSMIISLSLTQHEGECPEEGLPVLGLGPEQAGHTVQQVVHRGGAAAATRLLIGHQPGKQSE